MVAVEFRVRRTPAGWVVVGIETYGPFVARDQAVDLARGMVSAVRATGKDAELIVEDDAAPPAAT
jgi:hypothetical protein